MKNIILILLAITATKSFAEESISSSPCSLQLSPSIEKGVAEALNTDKKSAYLSDDQKKNYLEPIKIALKNKGYLIVGSEELNPEYTLAKAADFSESFKRSACNWKTSSLSYSSTASLILYRNNIQHRLVSHTTTRMTNCDDIPKSKRDELEKETKLKARSESIQKAIEDLPACGQ